MIIRDAFASSQPAIETHEYLGQLGKNERVTARNVASFDPARISLANHAGNSGPLVAALPLPLDLQPRAVLALLCDARARELHHILACQSAAAEDGRG